MSPAPTPGADLRPNPCVEAEEGGKSGGGGGAEEGQEQVWRDMLARLSDSPVVRTGLPRSVLGTGQQSVWPQITSLSHLSSSSFLGRTCLQEFPTYSDRPPGTKRREGNETGPGGLGIPEPRLPS